MNEQPDKILARLPQEVKDKLQNVDFTYFVDSTQELEEEIIRKTFDSENPEQTFKDLIDDLEWYTPENQDFDCIIEDLGIEPEFRYEYYTDICDYLSLMIETKAPYEFFNKEVQFDLYLGTPCDFTGDEIPDNITQLMVSQGYEPHLAIQEPFVIELKHNLQEVKHGQLLFHKTAKILDMVKADKITVEGKYILRNKEKSVEGTLIKPITNRFNIMVSEND